MAWASRTGRVDAFNNMTRYNVYAEEERLVSVGITAPIDPNEFVVGADYLDWRAGETPFESMGTHVPGVFDCDLTDQNPVRVSCASVEASLFPTLGIQPILDTGSLSNSSPSLKNSNRV